MFGMGGTEILVILVVALLFLGPDKLPEAAKKISQHIRDIKKQTRVLQRTIEDDEHIGGAIRDLKSALRGDDEPVRPAKARAIEAAVAVVALPEPPAETPNLLPSSVHDAVTAPLAGKAYEAAADDAVAAHVAANGVATTYAAAITSTEPAEVVAATVPAPAVTPAAAAPAIPAPAIPAPAQSTAPAASASVTAPAASASATAPAASASLASAIASATSEPATVAPRLASTAVEPPALRMPATAGEADEDVPRSSAEDDAALAALVRPAPNTIARSTTGVAKPVAAQPAAVAESAAPSDSSEPKHG